MTYAVHVDIEPPAGSPELDPLQREGVAALLDGRIARIASIDGPDDMQAEIDDYRVAVHPTGALLLMMTDAPALEFAEGAIRHVVDQILEDTELLADWTVVKARVELNDQLALESLAAADGPDAPPPDPRQRAAAHATAPETTAGMTDETREEMRARLDRYADRLTGFSLADFGAYQPDDDFDDEDGGAWVPNAQARLAAGALVWAIETLIDELFQDIETLARDDADTEECLVLSALPPRCADQYTGLFAKRFLVTTIALTSRLTGPHHAPLASVAEELALRLLIEQAHVVLDLYDLADPETDHALASLKDAAYEDYDHEDLYDEDDDSTANPDASTWFAPFNATRHAHFYAHNPDQDPRRS
ncbi:hypothetical protein [Actinocrinis sp.]|uniref:hypothetical protein n=1 Tax=Actinocrinis sp. TaxID=1920516 RepID=UPI002DDD3856|nr:hypothetical protein [Actinocrinis sp.]